MKDLKAKLLAAFDVEHQEHLVRIRAFLAVLPGLEDAVAVRSAIAEAFRSAHSLKGASRVVDLKPITDLAHHMEALFLRIQSGKQTVSADFLDTIRRALDMIEDIVAASRTSGVLPETEAMVTELILLVEGSAPPDAEKRADAAPQPPPPHLIPASPAPSETLSSAATHLKALTPQQTAVKAAVPSFDTMRLSAEHFDRLIKTAGEVIGFSRNQEENEAQFRDMNQLIQGIEKEWALVQKKSTTYLREVTGDAHRAGMIKYLMFVESQIRTLGRQVRRAASHQKSDNFTLRNLGEQLQEDVQTARLIPAIEVLGGFSKMMRDLAKDEDKDLDFSTFGLEIQADRVVLQALKDPLMHILRNALSHGIESKADRDRSRKSPRGRITLTLESDARRLTLVVADDGQGIAPETLREKAIAAGIHPQSVLEGMSHDELRQLIFDAGFSTAASITAISGRGVGLAVVKDAIERLQGEVRVDSLPGAGCRFTIAVPLTLSTHRLLLVRSQNQILALPTHAVQNVQRARREDILTIEDRPVIKVRGVYVPVMALSQLLGMHDGSVNSHEDTLAFAILRVGERKLAIAVDSLVGEREGLIKPLGPPLAHSHRFSGGLLLDRSAIALVIHPPALFEAYQHLRQGKPLTIAKAKEEPRKLRILVVDDSFTTRILERSILEAKGYHVDIATDGLEALSFLAVHDVDLIISDVEMPRMDGLTLLQEVKASPRLAKTPVIMVSSRDAREDQEKGLNLGADAYLSKQEFNQAILLDTIRQVI